MQREVTYYAKLEKECEYMPNGVLVECEDEYFISFPDIPHAYTCAYTKEDAIRKIAIELEYALNEGHYKHGLDPNPPSSLNRLRIDNKDNCEFIPITVTL